MKCQMHWQRLGINDLKTLEEHIKAMSNKCQHHEERGTKFEVEYALKLRKPVQLHWENSISETFYQYFLPVMEKEHAFFLAWQEFFCKTALEIEGEQS